MSSLIREKLKPPGSLGFSWPGGFSAEEQREDGKTRERLREDTERQGTGARRPGGGGTGGGGAHRAGVLAGTNVRGWKEGEGAPGR